MDPRVAREVLRDRRWRDVHDLEIREPLRIRAGTCGSSSEKISSPPGDRRSSVERISSHVIALHVELAAIRFERDNVGGSRKIKS